MAHEFRTVIVIGPTASGKTSLAHALADRLHAQGLASELVNLDAFQLYRGVSAGTAKPSEEEMAHYKYHCVDIAEVETRIDAQTFAIIAQQACREVYARGSVPICVGGSGLYLRAFLHGLDPLPHKNDLIREFLRNGSSDWGWAHLHQWLSVVDPVRAAELHPNDGVRIERALEIFFLTGKRPSEVRSRTEKLAEQESLFDSLVIQVDASDAVLKERIRERVPRLFALGWEEEVRALQERWGAHLDQFQCMKAIGYREIHDWLQDPVTYPGGKELEELIATRTWQYARRQRVWNAKERCDLQYTHEAQRVDEICAEVLRWFRVG